jgi:hypothetical protein
MHPKLALASLLILSAIVANAQNNAPDSIRDSYHIFFPAMGKDILAAHIGDHSYKIVNIYDKPAEVYVDNRLIGEAELSKYDDIIQKIKASVKDDDEERETSQMERLRRQVERDRRQAERDQDQAAKNREQHQRDREQQQINREQQQRDHEQQQRDREQRQRDREQIIRVGEQSGSGNDGGWIDDDQEEQRHQSAEDRVMLKKGIQALVDGHVIDNTRSLKTLVLTDTDITVNGIRQPQNIYQQVRTTLGDWAIHGLSYGADSSTDNYSISIID